MDLIGAAAEAAPFVARGADVFSKIAGYKFGALVCELCLSLAIEFKGDSFAERIIAEAIEKPDSEARMDALKTALIEKMQEDPDFARNTQRLIDEMHKEGARLDLGQKGQTVSGPQSNISGGVQKSVFSGQFEGAATESGNAFDLRGAIIAISNFIDKSSDNENKKGDSQIPFISSKPPSDLTGRDEELKELAEKFSAGTNAILLHGNGGVGKTALALKLAQFLIDRYPDGQIMVDMMGTTNPIPPMDAMGVVINSFYPEERIPDSEAKVKDRCQRILRGKRVLILLDNALNDKQVSGLISPPEGCGLLVTSRNVISGIFRKDLDVLKPEHAVNLLLGICFTCLGREKSSRKDPTWPEIASLCGRLPLALRAAACYLANSDDVSPKKYVLALKDERTRLERIGKEGTDLDIEASFNLSYGLLAPETAHVFRMLSIFHYDFDAEAEEEICQDEEHKHLSELLRWSMIEYQRDTERYRLHDLVRIFAGNNLRSMDKATSIFNTQLRYSYYYERCLSKANTLYLESGRNGIELFERERENVIAGQRWAEENIDNDDLARELSRSYPNSGVYVLDVRIHPEMKISWLKSAIAACQMLGDIHGEGANLGNMGSAYAALGDARKAIDYYEQRLVIAREIGDRRGEGNALGNMGNAYAALGDARKAIDYYEQALAIDREIGDRRGEANASWNLGLAYENAGDLRRAAEVMQICVDYEIEIGHPDAEKHAERLEAIRAKSRNSKSTT